MLKGGGSAIGKPVLITLALSWSESLSFPPSAWVLVAGGGQPGGQRRPLHSRAAQWPRPRSADQALSPAISAEPCELGQAPLPF